MRRTLVAFLVAPILPALPPAWFLHTNYPNRMAISGFIVVCGLFYLLQTIVGIPAYLLGRSRRSHLTFYLLVGFLGSVIPFIAISTVFWTARFSISETLFTAVYLGILGGATGLIFWLAARPDKRSSSDAQLSN
jgi:hypothetical protein